MTYKLVLVLPTICVLALAGCKSSEERADDHFESAMELIASGDFPRAQVEFRNVFDLNGRHREARATYAKILRERGDVRQSYSQYLRLVEQFNTDLEARIALGEMAFLSGDLDEAARHVAAGSIANPESDGLRVVDAAVNYAQGLREDDVDKAKNALERIKDLSEIMPENIVLQKVIVDNAIRDLSPKDALPVVDTALENQPEDIGFLRQRLALLNEMEDTEGVTLQLQEMMELFPEDANIKRSLLQWYITQNDLDAAEGFLRDVAQTGEGDVGKLDLITFLAQYRSTEAALDELDLLIAAEPENITFGATRAQLNFSIGQRDEAIAELRGLLSMPGEEQRVNDIKVTLANMLIETGNVVGARALVEEVLEKDPSNVGALKRRADWLIDQDRTDEAIIALRSALDKAPDDPTLMTLMARAHERAGSPELASEMLALAVEASNNAPTQSIRYAKFLVARDQLLPAIGVLTDALQLDPNNPSMLFELGKVYIATGDWDGARNAVAELREIPGNEAASANADSLNAAIIASESGLEDSVDFLDDMVKQGRGGVPAQAAIVRAHVQNGDLGAARAYIDGAVAESPDEPRLRFILASIQALQGQTDAAEQTYRDLTEETPDFALAWRALYVQLTRSGRNEEAGQVLEAGLDAIPQDRDLRWAKAGALERNGSLEEAIAVYEALYEEDSSSLIVANNLASLTAEVSEDPESLDKALRIARRLRGSSFAPFQDTYGWIAYRTGDYASAVEYLRPAARQMTDNAVVQYHLGMALSKFGEREEALEVLKRALAIAGEASDIPQMAEARAEIERLENL